MRNFIYSFIFILIISSVSNAGLINSFGVKSGVVYGHRDFENPFGWSFLSRESRNWGIFVGGYFECLDNDYLNIITEIDYKQMRFYEEMFELDVDGISYKITWQLDGLDYLSIPVLLKLGYPINILKIYCISGVRLDILTSIKYKGDDQDIRGKLENEIRRYSVGVDFGFGVDIKLSDFLVISNEFRYSTDLTKSKEKELASGRNKSLIYLIGVGFL